jgi:hypothetical protein
LGDDKYKTSVKNARQLRLAHFTIHHFCSVFDIQLKNHIPALRTAAAGKTKKVIVIPGLTRNLFVIEGKDSCFRRKDGKICLFVIHFSPFPIQNSKFSILPTVSQLSPHQSRVGPNSA